MSGKGLCLEGVTYGGGFVWRGFCMEGLLTEGGFAHSTGISSCRNLSKSSQCCHSRFGYLGGGGVAPGLFAPVVILVTCNVW